MKNKIIATVIVILTFLVSGGSVYATTKYFEAHPKTVEVLKEVEKPVEKIVEKPVEKVVEKIVEKEVVISGKTIEAGLNNIGKLSTSEYYYTHVATYDSSKEIKGFKIPFTTSKFIYSYDGTICAGIDFTQIDVQKDDTNKKITVTLPAVEIISSEVEQDSFKLYDDKNSIFNPYDVTDFAVSFAELKTSEEKKAIENGLFSHAKENAKSIVENFMKGSYNVGDYEIEVKFEQF